MKAHVTGGTGKSRHAVADALEKVWPGVKFVELRQPKARRVAKAKRKKL
jgi:hypothetical protein